MCLRLLHVFMIDARTQDSASGFRANHFLAYKHIRRRCFHGFRAFGVAPLSPMAAELPPYVQAGAPAGFASPTVLYSVGMRLRCPSVNKRGEDRSDRSPRAQKMRPS